jgi:hypothetical protein
MYKLTFTVLRYGEHSDSTEYYAKDDNQLAEIKNHLFDKETVETAVEIEYSIDNKECQSTDNWDSVYWTFEKTDDVLKWGYSLEIKPIKFGV